MLDPVDMAREHFQGCCKIRMFIGFKWLKRAKEMKCLLTH